MHPARFTEIYFPVENAPFNTKLKYEPDASFWHDDVRYPGSSSKLHTRGRRRGYVVDQLAEDYLMDSDASVRVVVSLNIEYESLKLIPGKIPESLQYEDP